VSLHLVRRTVRGLYAVTPDAADTNLLVRQVSAALEGGVRLVQYRNKSASGALKLEQARALKALCSSRGAALIVNDHLDVALAVDADGVHLGGADGSASAARRALGPHKLVGISCYDSIECARGAQRDGADHVAFGSFFASRVKPGAVKAPIELLQQAKAELEVPIVAIGGITSENGRTLVAAGADALAVITAVFDAPDIAAAAARFAPLFGSTS
jgi:thiamine-phosphate pyrophosphorylase